MATLLAGVKRSRDESAERRDARHRSREASRGAKDRSGAAENGATEPADKGPGVVLQVFSIS